MQNIIINPSTSNNKKNNCLLFQLIVVSLSHKLINKKHQSKTLCLLLT